MPRLEEKNRRQATLAPAPLGPSLDLKEGSMTDIDDPRRGATRRGVEEIDLESGRSLGSPVEEGAGVKPPDEEDQAEGET
jgi:hypothetical protein